MANRVELIGLREANRALKQLPEFAKSRVQPVMDTTAFQVYNLARARVPVRTGRLKAALAWESRPRSLRAVMGTADPQAFYWKFLEYGTVRMAARPFLRPAADAMRRDHEMRLIQALERAANDVEAAQGTS